MSNLETRPTETRAAALAPASGPVFEELAPREVPLGGPRAMLVRRTLPHRERRTVGAWCFLDHYGSSTRPADSLMHVPEHPHTGLQTVTWLFDGEVRHRDSLGSDQLVRPGELNLMTAGHGIAHAEDSAGEPPPAGAPLDPIHGLQLWVALPEASRDTEPAFAHHGDLPVLDLDGVRVTVLVGELAGEPADQRSDARAYTPLLGAEVVLPAGTATTLRLEPSFEHALLAVDGDVQVDGRRLEPGRPRVPRDRARRSHAGERRRRPRVPARRDPARRAAADVVELRRPHPRGHRRRARRLGGGPPFRAGARLRRAPRRARATDDAPARALTVAPVGWPAPRMTLRHPKPAAPGRRTLNARLCRSILGSFVCRTVRPRHGFPVGARGGS